MNFSSKKRPREKAWKQLQSELDEREAVEEANEAKFKKLADLKKRVCVEDEPNLNVRHGYMDLEIGRRMGSNPTTPRRVIFELFEDIMPRTTDQFVWLLEAEHEPTYRGSTFAKIYPGFYCEGGDRSSQREGASTSSGREAVFNRVEQEANWQLPHLNPGILSLADFKTSRFNITFRTEELDGWHAVFGKVVYGFDVLKAISDEGNTDGMPKQPVVVTAAARSRRRAPEGAPQWSARRPRGARLQEARDALLVDLPPPASSATECGRAGAWRLCGPHDRLTALVECVRTAVLLIRSKCRAHACAFLSLTIRQIRAAAAPPQRRRW